MTYKEPLGVVFTYILLNKHAVELKNSGKIYADVFMAYCLTNQAQGQLYLTEVHRATVCAKQCWYLEVFYDFFFLQKCMLHY
jgi:hypothetical protein